MSTKVEKIQINNNLIQYRMIEHLDRVSYYTSCYAYVVGDKAILIDAGLLCMGEFIKDDFKANDIQLEKIILTHYHKDHVLGSLAFEDPFIIVGSDYQYNKSRIEAAKPTSYHFKTPDLVVQDTCSFLFRETKFYIFKTPGHAPCGLTIIINDEYIFVGDLLLEDLDGKIIIPYIDKDAEPEAHLKSLRSLERFESKHLMYSHGQPKFNMQISDYLSHQIYYLERFIESDYQGNLDLCLMADKDQYAMLAIHNLNKRNALKKLKNSNK